MKKLLLTAGLISILSSVTASVAFADRENYLDSTQGTLTVVKAFNVATTKEDPRASQSMTLKPGSYAFEIGRGSYYKSTFCDLLPYCTKRWEDTPNFFMHFSLLKNEYKEMSKKSSKRVAFKSRYAKYGDVDGILPLVAEGQNFKVYLKTTSSSKLVNARKGKVECLIKSTCWDAYGDRCSYRAGTQSALIEDKIHTTVTRARIVTLSNTLLAKYEAVETSKEKDIATPQGACVPNID